MQHAQEFTYGVIGAGSFGTAVANILAENGHVLLFTRRPEACREMLTQRTNRGQQLHPHVTPTIDIPDFCNRCRLIFPVVPSAGFREVMQQFSACLQPHHILIHGTKGLNLHLLPGEEIHPGQPVSRQQICTMTEIILQETVVLRVGCLSGPNLAKEIAQGQPAATVIASRFTEVIEQGREALKSPRFKVYGSNDVTGVEFAGVLKNVMAIASGILSGLGLGENAKAMLISRGLGEMVKIGRALGADSSAFFGIAGIGDLIATCSSSLSRNFSVGFRLAKGELLPDILADMNEVVEGINTVKLAKGVSLYYHIETPIVEALYQTLYNNQTIPQSLNYLMNYSFDKDADFL
ncbi:NAD(P)-dependent glycerol-3-phosphate dehydrogenase [Sphingobacteriales bacterium UPWRP_1]|nr:glycerol 3-phosphate dehydrogenase [Sphingobacteriales bacterium TSM_CSM]PSJ72446.1 NAD(P)-dependent glycerol-3-phosphate dehydrogenase [Sphingobacteriales bacterium UPWRP_1]